MKKCFLPFMMTSHHPKTPRTAGREALLMVSHLSSEKTALPEVTPVEFIFIPLGQKQSYRHSDQSWQRGMGLHNWFKSVTQPFNGVKLSFNILLLPVLATFTLSLPPLSLPSFLAQTEFPTYSLPSAPHYAVWGGGGALG